MSSAANRNNRNHIRSIKQKAHRASDQTNDAGEEDGKRDDSNDVVAAVAARSLMKRVRRSPATTIAAAMALRHHRLREIANIVFFLSCESFDLSQSITHEPEDGVD